MSVQKIKEWFENLLGVDEIKFVYGSNFKSCEGFDDYDYDREVFTRKVLYFNPQTNTISTHSPYGSHWENNKDIKKIKSDENFRWVIKGKEYLSCLKPCKVYLEDYEHNIITLRYENEDNIKNTIKEFELIVKMMYSS